MPIKVLIPVDAQECTMSALESVRARCWEPGTKFLLCKVVEDFKLLVNTEQIKHEGVLAAEQESYTCEMRMWLNELTASFASVFPDTTSRLDFGDVPTRICEIAYEWGADYIVIGSHDLEMTSRCALGSVASSVLRGAPCSVEAVRFRTLRELLQQAEVVSVEQIRSIANVRPMKVIVATDLSVEAEFATDWVSTIDWPPDCTIRLVTVTSPQHKDSRSHWFGGIGTVYVKEGLHQKTVETDLKKLAVIISEKIPSITVETEVIVAESTAEAIVKLANEWEASLVVTGARGATRNPEVRAGSTVLQILDRLHCSMIAIQSDWVKPIYFSWNK